ncbi:MAG: hypothetical protein FJ041_01285 [Candidatus Cloacimonetes bacterium]|nr:hypothetical protein [Candidatus Cloacimonadota bacterium]
MNQMEAKDTIEISFFELLLAVAKRKKFVIRFTLLIAILVTAICLIIPSKWKSESLIVPVADNTSKLNLSANLLSSFSNLPLLTSQKNEMALDFLTVMDSRTFREDVIHRFNLIKYFKINKPDSAVAMDIALRKYNDRIFQATLEPQTNSIQLSVTTKERYLSRDMADYILNSLASYMRTNKRAKSTITREFLEQRTNDVKTRIDTLLAINRLFESQGKTYALSEQTTQTLTIYSDLVSRNFMNDIELELARKQFDANSPKIKELENKSILLKQKIEAFEKHENSKMPKYILNLESIPGLNMDYNRIQMDLEVMNQIYQFLYPMLESAKLTELEDMPQFDIMDKPSLAGLHAYPKRLLIIIMVTLAGLLFSSLLAVMQEFMSTESRKTLRQILFELGSKQQEYHSGMLD